MSRQDEKKEAESKEPTEFEVAFFHVLNLFHPCTLEEATGYVSTTDIANMLEDHLGYKPISDINKAMRKEGFQTRLFKEDGIKWAVKESHLQTQ